MSIYAIGDLHLAGNPAIDKPMDRFGAEWINHFDRLRTHWDATIKDEDTVILAGDISWALKLNEAMDDLLWIDSMPGKKVIIRGNHDLWWSGITKMNQMFDTITFLQNKSYETDEYIICGSRGWICPGPDWFDKDDEKIFKRETLRLRYSLEDGANKNTGKEIIGVLHYPPTNDKFQQSEFTKLFEEFGIKKVVYGHLHGTDGFPKGVKGEYRGIEYKLVSLDYLNCKPLLLV